MGTILTDLILHLEFCATPVTDTLLTYALAPEGIVTESERGSKFFAVTRTDPSSELCMVYDGMKGLTIRNSRVDGMGNNPMRWKSSKVAMAPLSSLPGPPPLVVLKSVKTRWRTRLTERAGLNRRRNIFTLMKASKTWTI